MGSIWQGAGLGGETSILAGIRITGTSLIVWQNQRAFQAETHGVEISGPVFVCLFSYH